MYSVILHAHQKLDRVAYRHFQAVSDVHPSFPSIKEILYFEGNRGPDSTNFKNKPGVEQPWHFFNPLDEKDVAIYGLVQEHHDNMVKNLRKGNTNRVAFEAAWLAHALVDGMTPAHHYPYEQELENLFGAHRDEREGLVGRAIVKGDTAPDSIKKSFQLLGPKGLLTTHAMFEGGAYSILAPLRLNNAKPSEAELKEVEDKGIVALFRRQAIEITGLNIYDDFYKTGWTPDLARRVRRDLAPRIARTVTLAWYDANRQANR
ncbi:MAG: hypothetical protein JWM37_824 [Candidatus Saccharibacteria bacterium]|nr:hypothetical protein [Candidatus Saccharibacteria bacterium]